MKFRRTLSVLLAIFALTVFSCENWMKDDDLYSDIERDVKVANATKINVFVRFAATAQGITSPNGSTTFKVGIPQEITATTETEYGFIRWAAFSTNDYPAGLQHRTLIFVDEDDYETNLSPKEIKSPTVVFSNAKNPNTTVTINSTRNDIFLVPLVTARPEMGLSIPSNGEKEVTRNMSIRISFSKPMDPLSFVDAVSITEGSLTLIGGEVEISSKNISNLFEPPTLSKSGKTLTLKFTPEGQKIGYDPKTTVNVIVSKQVKDTFGFSMVQDGSLSFTAGSTMDTWAPRITQLTGGKNLDFAKFQGMYKLAETQQTLKTLNLTNIIITKGSDEAPIESASDSFYTQSIDGSQKIIANRVKDKVTLRVFAEDLTQTNDGHVENDVDLIAIRSKTIFNNNASYVTPSDTYNTTSLSYVPRGYVTRDGADDTKNYEALVNALNENNVFGANGNAVGCILVYDLIDEEGNHLVPDGIVQIDVAAIDNVGNDGFNEAADVSKVQGNGYASIFVVKDTTPPTGLNDNRINLKINNTNVNSEATNNNFYNTASFETIQFVPETTYIKDVGDSQFCSNKEDIKWTILPVDETINTNEELLERLSASDIVWKKYNSTFDSFTAPTEDNANGVRFAYALKDDMDNINAAFLERQVKYDCTNPILGELSWTPVGQAITGVTTNRTVSNQILVIPVTDSTSGVREIEVLTKKDGTNDFYTSPFASGSLEVTAKINNSEVTLEKDTDYTINGTKLTLLGDKVTSKIQQISIRALTVSDSNEEAKYQIIVKAYDAANNTMTSENPLSLSNDSTAPVVKKIIVPNINYGKTVDGADRYLADYTKLDTSKSSDNPRTSIYVQFTETNSGVKKFDFAWDDTKINFTSDTKIYKVTQNGDAFVRDGNSIDYKNDSRYLSILNDEDIERIKGDDVILEITDVQLPLGNSTIKVRIQDKATNYGSAITSLYSPNVLENGQMKAFTSFYFDSVAPTITSFGLSDRGTDNNSITASSSYTNERYVDVSLLLTQKDSGIVAFSIDGAVFDETTTISARPYSTQSSLSVIVNSLNPGVISSDGSTISFNNKVITGDSAGRAYIVINNIKLVDKDSNGNILANITDGSKEVKITPISLGGLALPSNAANNLLSKKRITLDTVAPEWNDDGLYVMYENDTIAAQVYPHPKNNQNVYGLKNIDSTKPNDLYFYTNGTQLKLYADIKLTEANLRTNHLYFTSNSDLNSIEESGITTSSSFEYLGLTPKTSDCTFEVYVADNAGNKSETKVFHIIKDTVAQNDSTDLNTKAELVPPSGFDSSKNIHKNKKRTYMPYHSTDYDYYNAPGDRIRVYNYILKKFDDPYKIKIKLSEYAQRNATTSSSPIEEYTIVHRYMGFSSSGSNYTEANFVPSKPNDTPVNSKTSWHPYQTGTYTDLDISSTVESNGDIVITLPDHSCPPLSLWIKDACGNTSYTIINLDLAETLGQSSLYGYQAVGWVIDGEVSSGPSDVTFSDTDIYKVFNNTVYYKGSPKIELSSSDFNDNAIFINSNGSSDVGYTLRTAFVLWEGTGTPTPQDVQTDTWVAKWSTADGYGSNNSTVISGTVQFSDIALPKPEASEAKPTQLWYIIEDAVGNYKSIQLKDGTNDKWMYDDQAPVVSVKENSATKVNYIAADNANYYSSGATVKYTVSDAGSGVYKDGRIENGQPVTYTSYKPSTSEQDYTLPDNTVNQSTTISITGVEDQLGNGAGTSVKLSNQGSDIWIRQVTPEINGITASIKPYKGDAVYNKGLTESDGHSASAPKIKLSEDVSKIVISFNGTNTDSLMGWLLKEQQLSSFDSFYPVSDSIKKEITIKRPGNTWNADKTYYLYAVNKAGLICQTPFQINIKSDIKPALADNTVIEYEDITEYKENGSLVQYYIKGNSSISLTANTPIKTWTLYYGTGPSDKVEHTYTTKTAEIQITLGTELSGKTISNANIYLVLDSGSSTSNSIYLKDNTSNKWTYDATPPSIIIASVKDSNDADITFVSNGIYYTKSATAKIAFTTDSDTIKYKMQTGGTGDYSDITVTNGIYTLTVPDNATQYSFKAVDKAGNECTSPVTIKIRKDTTGPSGTIDYTVYKGSSVAQQPSETASGDYIVTLDSANNKSTIKYNPNSVTKIVIDGSGISDNITDVGLPQNFFYYRKSGDSNNYIQLTDGVLNLDSGNNTYLSGKYYIYAKDKLGNISEKLWTFELTPYSTAPAPLTEKTDVPFSYLFDDNNTSTNIGTYNGNRINGFGQKTSFTISPDPDPNNSDSNKITDSAHQNWIIRAIAQDSTINLPLKADTLITNTVYYKIQICSVQHRPASTEFTAPASGWTSATVGDNGIISVPITTAQLADRNTFIFVWLKDEIGNISVYNIPYPKSVGENWWTADTTGPSGSVEYALKKDSADGSNYTVSTSGSTVTVTYNHALGFVNKLTLTPTLNDSDGVGVDGLYYKKGDNALQKVSDNSISLDDSYSTYEIYAMDKLGNLSVLLKKFVFVKDDTAPDGTVSFTPKQNGTEVTQSSTTYTLTQSGDKYTLTYVKTESTTTVDSVTISFTNTSSDLKSITMNAQTFTNNSYDFNISSITSTQTFDIVATDNCGNTKTWQLELVPVTSLSQPDGNAGSNSTFNVSSVFTGFSDIPRRVSAVNIAATQLSAVQSYNSVARNNYSNRTNNTINTTRTVNTISKHVIPDNTDIKSVEKLSESVKTSAKAKVKVAEKAMPVQEMVEISVDETISTPAKPVAKIQKSPAEPLVEVTAPVLKTTEVLETPEVSETVTAGIPSKVVIWLVLCTLCAAAAGLVVCLKKKRG